MKDQRLIHPELMKILVCPVCKKELKENISLSSLDCNNCRLRYYVKDGIPDLIIEDAESF